MKNGPQKLLIISPKLFFTLLARLPKPAGPELIFHIINMSQDSSVYWSVDGMYLLNFWTKVLLFWQNNWIVLPLNMTSLQSHTCAHFTAIKLRQKLHYHILLGLLGPTCVKIFKLLCGYAFCIFLISNIFLLGIKMGSARVNFDSSLFWNGRATIYTEGSCLMLLLGHEKSRISQKLH